MRQIDHQSTGTFVPRDEREQLLVAFVGEVHARGFEHASIAAISQRAGVAPARFSQHFTDLPDCITQALDVFVGRALSALAKGFMGTSGTWAQAAYTGFDAFFRFCVGSPDFMHVLAVELPHGGPAILERRAQLHALFTDFIRPALDEADPKLRPDGDEQVFAQLICGGVWEVFRTYAEEDRLPELLEALPWVAFASLAPLVGHDEALRVVDEGQLRAAAKSAGTTRRPAPAI